MTLYARALACLTRRDYAVAELRRKLLEKTDNVPEVEDILQRLLAQNLLDDNRFAENYVRQRQQRGYGPLRIRQELQQRGIPLDWAETALRNAGIDWRKEMQRLRQRKFGRKLPQTLPDKARQQRFLQYRGFSSSQIALAMKDNDDDDECTIT